MATQELMVWSAELEIGVPAIDEQHRILVDMLNRADGELQGSVSRTSLERLVRDLMHYALYHFDTEEELMLAEGYGDADGDMASRHCQEHRSFSETVATVQRDLAAGRLITREALMGFLSSWLVNHIMNTDRKLGEFLLQRGAGRKDG